MTRNDRRDNRGSGRDARSGRGRSSYDQALRQKSGNRRRGGWRDRLPLPAALMFFFAVVIVRLVMLQVVQAPGLAARGEDTHTTDVTISAKRGTIYDRNGNVLAMSVECRTLYCNPNAVTDKNTAAEVLADKLGGSASDYLSTLSQDTTFAYISKQVDTEIAEDVISTLSSDKVDGVYSMEDVKRVYPYGSVGGQVLGMLGTDGHGLTGLELQYDDVLSGTDGEMVMERGRDGQPVAGGAYTVHEATDGTDIIISLDINIQTTAEEQLTQAVSDASATSGNVLVTQPKTGEILAACSLPLADLTNPSGLTNEALNLSCVSSSYEPGSTMKVLTMAIGYETGTITKNSTFTVPPTVTVGDDEVGDADDRDYTMDMTPTEILRRSSNAGAALVGMAIGADNYAAGLEKFGIGQTTGIDYPGEAQGLVTSRENYTGATLGAEAFGQGIAFPSVQLVRAVGAIANKGTMVTPHFLVQKGGETVDWGEGTQVVSEQTCEDVIEGLRAVVQDDGTGAAANIDGYDVVGKTGTGEQASTEGGYVENSFLSSFIGFANGEDASVLCYVGIYGTAQHGSTAAAAPFKAIMSESLTDMNVSAS
jgi:cell division protein FtsI/penicillin-binding protein 2